MFRYNNWLWKCHFKRPSRCFLTAIFSLRIISKKWWFHQLGPCPCLNRVFPVHVVYAVINYMLRYTNCESVIANDTLDPQVLANVLILQRVMVKCIWLCCLHKYENGWIWYGPRMDSGWTRNGPWRDPGWTQHIYILQYHIDRSIWFTILGVTILFSMR